MNVVRYRYRLRPGASAVAALLREWDRCRWVWNQAVARLNDAGEWVHDDALTGWRREHEWLREGSVVAQQQMLRNFRAKRAQGKGRRKFKSGKRSLPSLNYTRRGFVVKGARLCLAGGLSIPVVWSRELPSEPSSVRVYRDSIGLLALVYPGALLGVLPLRRPPRLAISWLGGWRLSGRFNCVGGLAFAMVLLLCRGRGWR